MSGFVVDCSVTMAWCFEDETNAFTEAVLDAVVAEGAVVPGLWPLEVINVLLVGERKKRLTEAQAAQFLNRLLALPIEIEGSVRNETWARLQVLGRYHGLTAYDASFDSRRREKAHSFECAFFALGDRCSGELKVRPSARKGTARRRCSPATRTSNRGSESS